MKTTLVSVAELAAHPEWRVFDCRHDLGNPALGESQYAQGHLPGALHAHLDRVLAGPLNGRNGRHPLPDAQQLADWLGAQGLRNSDQVVVYDAAGGAYAARLWWLLRWLGHEAVAVLDGGLPAWQQQGHALSTEVPRFEATRFERHASRVQTVDTAAVLANVDQPAFVVVDARGAGRYAGQGETMDPRAGHIPGALNRPFTDNLDAGGLFKPATALRGEFQAVLSQTPAADVVAQCGSGVTACHNLLAMEVAGLGGARLYPGSWSEWCSDDSRPMVTGAAPR